MLERVCSSLKISDIKDFEMAEAVMYEAGAEKHIDEVVQEIAEKIISQDGWIINPIEMAVRKIIELSDYPECFEVSYNSKVTVECNLEKLKEYMKKDKVNFWQLNQQTQYLISKAFLNLFLSKWLENIKSKYKEKEKENEQKSYRKIGKKNFSGTEASWNFG